MLVSGLRPRTQSGMYHGISASHVHTQCVSHITSWHGTPCFIRLGWSLYIGHVFEHESEMTVLVWAVKIPGTSCVCECVQMRTASMHVDLHRTCLAIKAHLWSVKAVECLQHLFDAVIQWLNSGNVCHRPIHLLVQVWIL